MKDGRRQRRLLITLMALLLLTIIASNYSIVGAQEEEMPRENTVIIPFSSYNPNWDLFNPFIPVWWAYDTGAQQVMYENMFYLLSSNGTVAPWLATGWEWVDDEYKHFRLHIREGVHWSDGEPFTSADVLFTYNDILLKYGAAVAGGVWAQEWIEEVTASDDYTVDLKMKKPYPRLLWHFCTTIIGAQWYAPKHLWEAEDPTEFRFTEPIGTGPYILITNEAELKVWEKDPNWWGTEVLGYEPVPDYIVWKYMPTKEVVMMSLVNNEIDVAGGMTGPDMDMITGLNPNITSWRTEAPYFWYDPCPRTTYVNCLKYPWNNARVRKAVALFLNRTVIQDASEPGVPELQWAWSPYPGLMTFVDQSIINQYGDPFETNPQKGRQILEDELGWTRDYVDEERWVYLTENGTRMEGYTIYDTAIGRAQAMQGQLEENGIWCTIRSVTHSPSYFAQWRGGLFDILGGWECGSFADPLDTYYNFHAKHCINWTLYKETGEVEWIAPIGEPTDSHHHNSMRWINFEFSELVDELETVPSDSTRGKEILKELQRIYIEEVPTLPTYQGGSLISFNHMYWTNWPSEENPYTGPDMHWGYTKFMFIAKGDYGIQAVEREEPEPGPGPTGVPMEITIAAVVVGVVVAAGITAVVLRRPRA